MTAPDAPFFSIVMPCHNRERTLARAIRSCQAQRDADFELLIVDDGSSDRSMAIAGATGDARIRVLRHPRNRGVCPARNTGMRAARGAWIVFLDSDDELLPDALQRIRARVADLGEDIGAAWFSCRRDDGAVLPVHAAFDRATDYGDYLRFLEENPDGQNERLHCVRAATREVVQWPENKMVVEAYHLEFARRFRSVTFADVLRLYHQDAGNQVTREVGRTRPPDRWTIEDRANGMRSLLAVHGADLRRLAPRRFAGFQRSLMRWQFMLGWRREGLNVGLSHLRHDPWSWKAWAIVSLGVIGPRALSEIGRVPALSATARVSARAIIRRSVSPMPVAAGVRFSW